MKSKFLHEHITKFREFMSSSSQQKENKFLHCFQDINGKALQQQIISGL